MVRCWRRRGNGGRRSPSRSPTCHPEQRPAAGQRRGRALVRDGPRRKRVRQSPLLVRDAALNAYVEGVVCRVAGPHCKDMRVYIVDMPCFNASMAPNGARWCSPARCCACATRPNWRVVLGHEFAHFRARHSLRRLALGQAHFGLSRHVRPGHLDRRRPPSPASSRARRHGFAVQAIARQRTRGRPLGFAAAIAQGYDPQAGVRLWERMRREEEARPHGKDRVVFASHPQSEERLADIRAAAARFLRARDTNADVSRGDAAVPGEVAGIGTLAAHLRHDDPGVRRTARSGPETQALYAFYLGEAYRRRNKNGDRQGGDVVRRSAGTAAARRRVPGANRACAARSRRRGRRGLRRCAVIWKLAPEAEDAAFVRTTWPNWRSTPDESTLRSAAAVACSRPARLLRHWPRRQAAGEGRHRPSSTCPWTRAGLGAHQVAPPGDVDHRRRAAQPPAHLLEGQARRARVPVQRERKRAPTARGTAPACARTNCASSSSTASPISGWVGVDSDGLRPHAFGAVEGLRFDLR